jgi:hypothetical protein
MPGCRGQSIQRSKLRQKHRQHLEQQQKKTSMGKTKSWAKTSSLTAVHQLQKLNSTVLKRKM